MRTKKIGWALVTSDYYAIEENAKEIGIVLDDEWWENIAESIKQFEADAVNLVGQYASNVSVEGHACGSATATEAQIAEIQHQFEFMNNEAGGRYFMYVLSDKLIDLVDGSIDVWGIDDEYGYGVDAG